jgi:hypothetical protein
VGRDYERFLFGSAAPPHRPSRYSLSDADKFSVPPTVLAASRRPRPQNQGVRQKFALGGSKTLRGLRSPLLPHAPNNFYFSDALHVSPLHRSHDASPPKSYNLRCGEMYEHQFNGLIADSTCPGPCHCRAKYLESMLAPHGSCMPTCLLSVSQTWQACQDTGLTLLLILAQGTITTILLHRCPYDMCPDTCQQRGRLVYSPTVVDNQVVPQPHRALWLQEMIITVTSVPQPPPRVLQQTSA